MLPLLLVDAFAERAFAGNPAAVCLLPRWPADRWLAALAAEMKQSETAYLVPAGSDFELRWFTPACEVDLCGHATLASAAVLWHRNLADRQATIVFHTRSGPLTASRRDELIELDFPATTVAACTAPDGLVESLGVIPKFVGRTRFDLLLELESEAAVRAAAPDFRALCGVECRGVIVTARASQGEFDFVSRFFAPGAGIDEDPVTGSAHCAGALLGPAVAEDGDDGLPGFVARRGGPSFTARRTRIAARPRNCGLRGAAFRSRAARAGGLVTTRDLRAAGGGGTS